MWSTRIAEAIRRSGAHVVSMTSDAELAVALEAQSAGDQPTISGAIVDMSSRRIDAVAAIGQVSQARLPVIAVAQHDDQLTRRRALQAGASRVFSYNKFFHDGTQLVERWLVAEATGASGPAGAATAARHRGAR
jgi:CheY-like chemotaxis protein